MRKKSSVMTSFGILGDEPENEFGNKYTSKKS
jgi:hypothetical protein